MNWREAYDSRHRSFGVLVVMNMNINLGISIDVRSPNVEIHFPFGFVRIGWDAAGLKSRTRSWHPIESFHWRCLREAERNWIKIRGSR